jgi:glycosyltransferase involved in cell wall biosynthesis
MATAALGYVLRMFPQLSETFVANEIRELEALGLPIRVFSYRRPTQAVPHECVRRLQSPVEYLPDPLHHHPRALLGAQLAARRRDPARHRDAVRSVRHRSASERGFDAWRRLLQAGVLAERLAETGIDALHAHFAHGATDVAMLACRLTGLRFGFTAHARDVWTAEPRRLAEKIHAADWVVTCNRITQEHLRGLAGDRDAEKIHLVYHGVDLAKFHLRQRPVDPDPPLLLSAGRLVAKKGFGDLLEACARLRDRGHRFRCLVVGEGPERPRLERQLCELRLGDRVELVGSRSQEALAELYRQATLFALPCRVLADGDRDGIPNVLVEAMASGLPVIATGISGIPELVSHDENGLLVAQGSASGLALALERLIGDSALRRRLAGRARQDVEKRFDSAANAQSLAALFRERRARRGTP